MDDRNSAKRRDKKGLQQIDLKGLGEGIMAKQKKCRYGGLHLESCVPLRPQCRNSDA